MTHTYDLPTWKQIAPATILALRQLDCDSDVARINALVADRLALSEAALQQPYARSGTLVVAQRMSWARTYLRGAGLITQVRRGVWRLTAAGRRAASLSADEIIALVQSAETGTR